MMIIEMILVANMLVSKDYIKDTWGNYINFTGTEAALFAASHGAVLPTPEMVDIIYRHATCRVSPSPADITSSFAKKQHDIDILIEVSLKCSDKDLIVGGFKDIVRPVKDNRVAIYGWPHPLTGNIQPFSHIHKADYTDYSHGLRLVILMVEPGGNK